MATVISWLFFLYFLILSFERMQSLVNIGFDRFFSTGFDLYVNVLASVSILASLGLLIVKCKDFWVSLFINSVTPDYLWLSITAGVLLVSGMVHTEHTIAPVQFGAYGVLIIAMILRTIQTTAGAEHTFSWWYSLAFVVVFSMAIPVVYPTKIARANLFYCIEAVVSLALVVCFTLFLIGVMTGEGANLLWLIPILIVAVGDALILILRWKESVNSFVLIFGSLSVVMFVVGRILTAVLPVSK